MLWSFFKHYIGVQTIMNANNRKYESPSVESLGSVGVNTQDQAVFSAADGVFLTGSAPDGQQGGTGAS